MARSRKYAIAWAMVAWVAAALSFGRADVEAPAAPPPAQQATVPAAERYKNLQVLGDIPADELQRTMHFIRASLGVRCDHCHVTEDQRYDLDDRPAKAKARTMIRLVRRLNAEQFDGKSVVTCNTCHHGNVRPAAVPDVTQGSFPDTTHTPPSPALPTGAEVLDRYIAALGGRQALESVRRRVSTGILLKMQLVGAGTPKAAAVNRGRQVSLEVVQDLEGTAQVIVGAGDPDQIVQTISRDGGRFESSHLNRALTEQELARARDELDLRKDLALRSRAEAMRVSEGLIDQEAVYILEEKSADGRRTHWYFDRESRLLVRRVVYIPMTLGDDLEQTDYSDYRDTDGIKLPFTLRTSYLDDNHLGTTRRFSSIKNMP